MHPDGRSGDRDRKLWLVQILDLQPIGPELAIKWSDGTETFISLEKLRRCCPCAGCKGEVDIMGNVYRGTEKPLSTESFRLVRVNHVGGYAIQPVWADGHTTGLFSFDYLKRLGDLSAK